MAADYVVNTGRVQKFFDDLLTHQSILTTCTDLFTALSKHFDSLQDSISQKSQSLESKFQSLESTARETLESLEQRENSIPERESAAAARIEEQKEAALAEFDKPTSANVELSETLKSLSRKMDASGLLRFIVLKRKESASLRAEIVAAIAEAVDPPRLVLDALDEFLNSKGLKSGLTDKRWACGVLIQALFPETRSGVKFPEFSRSIMVRAMDLAELWKGQMDGYLEIGVSSAAEAAMFLQIIVGFGLREKFDEEYLRKLVMEFSSRRDVAKLAAGLGFGEKMSDIIDELVKNGKEMEAVYFAYESGLTGRFPPVDLLKSYLQNSRKNAVAISKNGNNSQAATEEASTIELNSIRAILKCVEDFKLESEFNLDILKKRAAHLEKARAERKKNSSSGGKSQNKRVHGGSAGRGTGQHFRPAKAAKFSNSYGPFSRRNPVPPQVSPASRYTGPYNYPSIRVYESPATNRYGAPHTQGPAALTQQHYTLPVDNTGATAFEGHTSYGAYDYGNAAPTYQPPSYAQ